MHFKKDARCVVVAFSASLCVLAKTVLYGTIEAVSGSRHTRQNDWFDFILLYVIPNGLWIVLPLLIVVSLGSRMATLLSSAADRGEGKKRK